MHCKPYHNNPLSEAILAHCCMDPWQQLSVKHESNCSIHTTKLNFKCRLQTTTLLSRPHSVKVYSIYHANGHMDGCVKRHPEAPFHLSYLKKVLCRLHVFHLRPACDNDDVINWKHFPRYWTFVRRIHLSPVNSPTKASDAEIWCFLWSAHKKG